MLSFDTTHAVTGCLLEADAHAATYGFRSPPALLVLHDRPLTPPGQWRLRELRAVAFTLHPHDVAEHAQGIPGVLSDLAATLDAAVTDTRAACDPDVAVFTDAIVHAAPGSRLLAWAVLYHDLHATPGGIGEIRRVDAVDIDGRVYQITRLRGEALAVVVIDDQPDPDATPATHPGLTALLGASQRLARHPHHGAHP